MLYVTALSSGLEIRILYRGNRNIKMAILEDNVKSFLSAEVLLDLSENCCLGPAPNAAQWLGYVLKSPFGYINTL